MYVRMDVYMFVFVFVFVFVSGLYHLWDMIASFEHRNNPPVALLTRHVADPVRDELKVVFQEVTPTAVSLHVLVVSIESAFPQSRMVSSRP